MAFREESEKNPVISAAALIVAGGQGVRLSAERPKQYLPLLGKSVLGHTLAAFIEHPAIDTIQVVIGAGHEAIYHETIGDLTLPAPVIGSDSRQASVLAGLRALQTKAPEFVLIHDAARPFVAPQTIAATLAAAIEHGAAVPAISVTDSLKRRAEDGSIAEEVSRGELYRVQTPQVFRFQDILRAHETVGHRDHSDDAAVAKAAGLAVKLVPGGEANFKITRAEDLRRAERFLQAQYSDLRCGQGFDVHRFCDGDGLTLCGIAVPHDRALLGHSDADVGLHAVTDAILGAAAFGDIGQHFPPSDDRWRDQPSELFLRHALDLARRAGAIPVHVDLTLICEQPKIGPHRDAMRENLGRILALPLERVSIKATTTEGLGFTGRGEGIAAQAIASLRFRGENEIAP